MKFEGPNILIIIAFAWLTSSMKANAQSALSLSTGPYGGLYGAFNNPARLSYNALPWGIHLPAAGAFIQNDGLRSDYFSGLAALISGNYELGLANAASLQTAHPPDILLRNLEKPQTNLHVQGWAQLLGGYVQLGYHSLGVGIGNRAFSNLTNVGRNVLKHYYESFLYDSLRNTPIVSDGLNFQAATFTEVQLAWSWRFLNHYNRSAAWGVVFKPILGYSGVHAQFNSFNYTITNTDSLVLNDFSVSYANGLNQPYMQGIAGFGVDLGFEYVAVNPNGANNKVRNRRRIDRTPFGRKLKRSIRPIPNHYWRMGASLLDLGYIRGNANAYGASVKGVYLSLADEALRGGDGLESYFLDVASTQGKLQTDTMGYRLGLATAIGFQYDVWILDKYYFSASMVQRLPFMGDFSLRRLNHVMIAPRYESPWIEVGLPLSLYEYKHLQLGVWARFGPITLGTDRLGELIGFRRMLGADAYVSVNVLPLWK